MSSQFICKTSSSAIFPLSMRKAETSASYVYSILYYTHIHGNLNMRTNIEIDDKLLSDAMKATGASTKREVVELGLASLVKLKKQQQVKKYKGKLRWDGDLDQMRSN